MSKRKYLITGSAGQLAKEFHMALVERKSKVSAPPEDYFDITDFSKSEKVLNEIKPDVLINCAAYNAVDHAEDNSEIAYLVNSRAPEILAGLCNRRGIFFVHFSSDYVFDGKKQDLYDEDDNTNPLNVYGQSKLTGEIAVRNSTKDFLILRLSWVFGTGTQNFLYKLSSWAENSRILKISADEVSVPTYTEDVVNTTLISIEKGLSGLFHLTNSGYASRYELAKYFIREKGLDNVVIPVPMSSFETNAKRPVFSAMSNKAISKELGIFIPAWENGVSRQIKRQQRR